MHDLEFQLRQLRGRVCLVGLGNVDWGDDAAGVRLAKVLAENVRANVLVAGDKLERYLVEIEAGNYDHVVFLDAAEIGAEPGAVALLTSTQMKARFPQVSTHKLSLAAVAQLLESNQRTHVWLLGIQVQSLKPAAILTPAVDSSVAALVTILKDVFAPVDVQEVALCECSTT